MAPRAEPPDPDDVEDDAPPHEDTGDEGVGFTEEEVERPPELQNHAPSPPFKVVSDLLEEMSSSSARRVGTGRASERRRSYMQRFFELYRERVGLDLFPVVRLLVPDRDRQRSTYGVKEQVLAKLYIDALGLDKNFSSDAVRLLKWKEPAPGEYGAGDFAEIAYGLISSRSTLIGRPGRLTVDDVNAQLDALSKQRDSKDKQRIVRLFFTNCSPVEQKWIIRIILKDLKISVRERTVLQLLHPDGVSLFNVCSDLRRVCWTLWDHAYHLPREDQDVKTFMSFRPMLCKRNEKSLEHIVKSMHRRNPDKTFYIEEKLDGERIQLHMKQGDFRYYSRNDKDYSYLYGRTARETSGALTKYIVDNIVGVDEIILDGEMMVFDPVTGRFSPFGFLKQAAVDKSGDPNRPRACFKVFDVLYLKLAGQPGLQLLGTPLFERRKLLMACVKERRGYLEHGKCILGKSVSDIRDELEKILDNNGEGLVIKQPRSTYVLNGREETWCKVKPDYMDSLGETFDVTCIGAFWGSGKRGGNFGSFMCGVRDEKSGDFLSFTKVGSGLSLSHIKILGENFGSKWKEMPRNKSQNPPGIKFRAERPDVYIAPEESFVITVKASEILIDPMGMASGLCLRFPRIERIHTGDYAKDPLEQLSYADLVGKKNAAGSMKRVVTSDNLDAHKRRRIVKPATRSKIYGANQADLSNVERQSGIFDGLHLWIIAGLPKHSKQDLEKLVIAHGGKIAQSVPHQKPRRIISRRANFMQAKSLIDQGHSLIDPKWILDSVEAGSALRLSDYYVHESDQANIDGIEDLPSRASAVASADGVKSAHEPDEDESPEREADDDVDFASMKRIRAAMPDTDDEADDQPVTMHDGAASKDGRQAAESSWSPALVRGTTDPENEDSSEGGADGRGHRYIAPAGPGMAPDRPVRDYDDDAIFKHLTFYFDTWENAAKLSLPHSNALREDHPTIRQVTGFVSQQGGRVTGDITDAELTHIVFAKKDLSRQQPLRRLSAPEGTRQKRLITTDWISDCYADEVLLNEQDYAPR